MNDLLTLTEKQKYLRSISIDDINGFETLVNNANKPAIISQNTIKLIPKENILIKEYDTKLEKELIKNKNKNKLYNYIDNLEEKQKRNFIIVFFVLSISLFIIVIIK